MKKNNIKNKIFATVTILAILLTGLTTMSSSVSEAKAGFFCQSFGTGMGVNKVNFDVADADSTHREWTVQELFSNSVGFTTYFGEGESTSWFSAKENRGQARAKETFGSTAIWDDEKVQDRLNSARSMSCIVPMGDSLSNLFPNLFLGLASLIIWFTKTAMNLVLGEDFMVGTLVGIIGGDGDQVVGLIGTFLNSLYLPLVVLAGTILAVVIAWKAFAKGKIREAFMDLLWAVSASIIGIMFMLQPVMLAELPQTITSTVSTCMIGALTGQNCITGEVTTPSLVSGKECMSSFEGGGNSSSSLANSMNCTIWKTFVLEEWAQEQFGTSYNNLYTYDAPKGSQIWSSLPEGSGEKYCVNLGSTKSPSSQEGGTVILDEGERVCNVALYQLYLKTDAWDNVNQVNSNPDDREKPEVGKDYDARWFDIITPMASSGEGWNNWEGTWRAWPRTASALLGVIASGTAAYILVTLSILGAVYKVTGVVMMAFAPIFLLMAIEPTKGRSIFLGWLESFVSAMLKYFAITMMLIIALIMYSATLNNVSGMTAVIAVIVLTITLNMYKDEIIEIIGASNMGGKRLSNKVGDAYDKASKKADTLKKAAIGGAAGAVMASRSENKESIANQEAEINRTAMDIKNATNEEDRTLLEKLKADQEAKLAEQKSMANRFKESTEAMKDGSKASTQRILKRGTGFTGSVYSQKERTKRELEKEEAKRKQEHINSMTPVNETIEANKADSAVKWSTGAVGGLSKIEVERQRDKSLQYEGKLSDEEKMALDKFADALADASNEGLLDTENNDDIMSDTNRSKLVSNEINARITAKTLKGEASGDLSRHKLAHLGNATLEERDFNIEMLKDNYLESHSKDDLAKYHNALNETIKIDKNGNLSDEELLEKITMVDEVEKISKAYQTHNIQHERTTPNKEELESNPDKYSFKGEKLKVPTHIQDAEANRKKIEAEKDKSDDDNDSSNNQTIDNSNKEPKLKDSSLNEKTINVSRKKDEYEKDSIDSKSENDAIEREPLEVDNSSRVKDPSKIEKNVEKEDKKARRKTLDEMLREESNETKVEMPDLDDIDME